MGGRPPHLNEANLATKLILKVAIFCRSVNKKVEECQVEETGAEEESNTDSTQLLSEPGFGYFPRTVVSGEVQYTTPPAMVDQLQALVLSPIDFTVKLK